MYWFQWSNRKCGKSQPFMWRWCSGTLWATITRLYGCSLSCLFYFGWNWHNGYLSTVFVAFSLHFISMVLLERQKIQDRIWYHSCGWLQVAGFYWWEIFRCLYCAITTWKQAGQVPDHSSCLESLSGWTSFHWGMLSVETMLNMQACIFIVGVNWNLTEFSVDSGSVT